MAVINNPHIAIQQATVALIARRILSMIHHNERQCGGYVVVVVVQGVVIGQWVVVVVGQWVVVVVGQ